MADFGFVYILRNEAMPGLYKVGATTRSPHQRAKELCHGTGVAHEYEVVFYGEAEAPFVLEKKVHAALNAKRLSSNREFFYGPLIDIIKLIEADDELYSSWDADYATEARNPGKVWVGNPLWFERNLHSAGYIERMARESE